MRRAISSAPGSSTSIGLDLEAPRKSRRISRRGRARSLQRHHLVFGARDAQHRTTDGARVHRACACRVKHPEEQLEEGATRFRPEFVEHSALLRVRDAIQTQDAGKIEVRIDDSLPGGAQSHQVLTQLFLAIGLGRMPARGAGHTRTSARARPLAASCWASTAPIEWPSRTGCGATVLRKTSSSLR